MRKGDPITTYSGLDFYILDPKEEEILEVDIAHALSLLCRANGHFRSFYSVAQHSLNCLKEAAARGYSLRVQMACLVHDGSEAYLSDITRPVKQYLSAYHEFEEKIQKLVYRRFGVGNLTEEERLLVALVDDLVLHYEFASLHQPFPGDEPEKHAEFDFSCRPMADVEAEFLRELSRLKTYL